jgi:inner membrane protein
VDSLTHALLAAALLFIAGLPEYIPFAVLGAVILDADIVLKLYSDRDPGLYIYTHGGFVHSIPGAVLVATGAFLVIGLLAGPWIPGGLPPALSGGAVWLAVVSGAILHVSLDVLAFPGLPVFFPFSDRKFTLGIFAGPSLFMLGVSAFFLVLLLTGVAGIPDLSLYGLVFLAVLATHLMLKISVSSRVQGMAIPTLNPFWWLVLREDADSFRVCRFHLFRGVTGLENFPRRNGVTGEEVSRAWDLPELKRLRYYSYAVIAERDGPDIIFSDPLRKNGYIPYPPYYSEARLRLG